MTRSFVALERNTADSGFGFGFDFLFGLRCTIPVAEQEARFLDFLFELFPSIHLARVSQTEIQCLLVDIILNLLEQVLDGLHNIIE